MVFPSKRSTRVVAIGFIRRYSPSNSSPSIEHAHPQTTKQRPISKTPSSPQQAPKFQATSCFSIVCLEDILFFEIADEAIVSLEKRRQVSANESPCLVGKDLDIEGNDMAC